MPLYRPSELQQFLATLGISPKKSLSQNFLIDGNILRKISQFADLHPADQVIEIGPGPGALTEQMLDLGCFVVAIEKDRLFAEALSRLVKGTARNGRLNVFEADVMDVDFIATLDRLGFGRETQAKVVANIPYHLTTPIMEKIILNAERISMAVLMVQEEVARRCVAHPGTKDYSSLTIFLQFYTDVQYGFLVPARCFYPIPRVESAVIRLTMKKELPLAAIERKMFFKIIHTVFQQRRKMIKVSLRQFFDSKIVVSALEKIHKTEKTRPEELSVAEWVQFFQALSQLLPNIAQYLI